MESCFSLFSFLLNSIHKNVCVHKKREKSKRMLRHGPTIKVKEKVINWPMSSNSLRSVHRGFLFLISVSLVPHPNNKRKVKD